MWLASAWNFAFQQSPLSFLAITFHSSLFIDNKPQPCQAAGRATTGVTAAVDTGTGAAAKPEVGVGVGLGTEMAIAIQAVMAVTTATVEAVGITGIVETVGTVGTVGTAGTAETIVILGTLVRKGKRKGHLQDQSRTKEAPWMLTGLPHHLREKFQSL